MTEKQITYYLIEKCRLGKKEDVAYYLFIDADMLTFFLLLSVILVMS